MPPPPPPPDMFPPTPQPPSRACSTPASYVGPDSSLSSVAALRGGNADNWLIQRALDSEWDKLRQIPSESANVQGNSPRPAPPPGDPSPYQTQPPPPPPPPVTEGESGDSVATPHPRATRVLQPDPNDPNRWSQIGFILLRPIHRLLTTILTLVHTTLDVASSPVAACKTIIQLF